MDENNIDTSLESVTFYLYMYLSSKKLVYQAFWSFYCLPVHFQALKNCSAEREVANRYSYIGPQITLHK
jgi:hypothetical protein